MPKTKVNLDPAFQSREFDTAIEALKAFQPQLKAIIASTDLNRFRRENYRHLKHYPHELYQELCDLYFYALFFPDEETKGFFKALGLTEKALDLMMPLEQMVGLINNIADYSPACQKQFAFWSIQGYLKMKIARKVQRWANYIVYSEHQSMNILYRQWRNYFRRNSGRRKPSRKWAQRGAWTEMNIVRPVLEVYGDWKKTKAYFLGVAAGSIDNHWFKRIGKAFFPQEMSNEDARALFELFHLIAKEYKLLSDGERLSKEDKYETTSDLCYRAKRVFELMRCKVSVFESQ